MRLRLGLFTMMFAAACAKGGMAMDSDAGGVVDGDGGAVADAAPPPIDGAPLGTAPQITTGGGKVSGSIYQMDVQIGHGMTQGRVESSAHSVEGAATIK